MTTPLPRNKPTELNTMIPFDALFPTVSFWVHNLDPVIVHLGGPLALRWYGMAYLAGFLVAWRILLRLSKRGELAVSPDDLSNWLIYLAVYGVFLGGRLGYVLFYAWTEFLRDPLLIVRIWEGGMSSHGGMIGVIGVCLWTARKKKIPFLNLTDALALTAPIGIFLGRIANFINGELWGRPTQVPWAVIFPQAGDTVPRHPSQLYEALGEGLLLFAALWLLRHRCTARRNGFLSAAFLLFYATARIVCELFREPDSPLVLGVLTRGQLFSLFMIPTGIVLLFVQRKQRLACP